MLGPSQVAIHSTKVDYDADAVIQSALVTVGGRFPPCMKLVEGIPSDTKMACLLYWFLHSVSWTHCLQVSITPPTRLINCAPWRKPVLLVGSTMKNPISGSDSLRRFSSMVCIFIQKSLPVTILIVNDETAGIVHLLLNMLAQATSSAQV